MQERFEGEVVWFDNKVCYGFISRANEKDLFVHFSDITCEGYKTIKKGQKVSFTLGVNNRGEPKATDVKVM